jgi:hypothetical protein
MPKLACAAALLTLAFAPTERHYALLASVAYHNELKLSQRDGKDTIIVAFMDENSAGYAEQEKTFNRAAQSIKCLAAGGVHVVLTGEDDRAKFIAEASAPRFFASNNHYSASA